MNPLPRPLDFGLFSLMALALLATPARLQAFGGPPGGPFSNGSYFPNDGTFSAVVRGAAGSNLIGTMQFSTTSGSGPQDATTATLGGADGSTTQSLSQSQGTGGVGSTGISNFYYNGSSFRGNSQGSYNPQSSGMTVTFQGQAAGLGNGTMVVEKIYTSTTTTNGSTTTTQQVIPIKTINYFDSKSLNGYANCSTSNAFPNQKFQGRGEVVVKELDFNNGNSDPIVQTSAPLDVTVTGVRLSNTASNFSTTSITSPSVVNTSFVTNP